MHYAGPSFIDYARAGLRQSLDVCAFVCVRVQYVCVDVSILSHLGLNDIKRSMEATRHCCLATATNPPQPPSLLSPTPTHPCVLLLRYCSADQPLRAQSVEALSQTHKRTHRDTHTHLLIVHRLWPKMTKFLRA